VHETVAELPCTIAYTGSQWRVTVAGVAYAENSVLAAAMVGAFGGLIERNDVLELAESIERRNVLGCLAQDARVAE
jgi:hypothetical protein